MLKVRGLLQEDAFAEATAGAAEEEEVIPELGLDKKKKKKKKREVSCRRISLLHSIFSSLQALQQWCILLDLNHYLCIFAG